MAGRPVRRARFAPSEGESEGDLSRLLREVLAPQGKGASGGITSSHKACSRLAYAAHLAGDLDLARYLAGLRAKCSSVKAELRRLVDTDTGEGTGEDNEHNRISYLLSDLSAELGAAEIVANNPTYEHIVTQFRAFDAAWRQQQEYPECAGVMRFL